MNTSHLNCAPDYLWDSSLQQKLLPHHESNLLSDKLLLPSKKNKKRGFYPSILDRLSINKIIRLQIHRVKGNNNLYPSGRRFKNNFLPDLIFSCL